MPENIELSYVWDHTIIKILNHDIQSKMGNMIKELVVFNKLEDFNSLLEYTDDDFTPTGKFCYINENGEKLYRKLMKEFYNLRWFIQRLVDEYGDNEWTNPLHESHWTYRTNKQFMNYVNFTLKEMTPKQMKKNPIKPIIKVKTNEELDAEEGESNTDEQESTILNKEEEEYSTFSDMSKRDSESDIYIDDTQHPENTHTPETLQIHNTNNTTMHDKDNLIHDEYDTTQNENIIDIENRKVEGLITYSSDQQIFKFKVNSWGVNIEFTSYELKCTIHAILQHMGFYHTTENPCVIMRANHNTISCEYIIILQDELYITSSRSTIQEILHIVKEKYKIKINPNNSLESNFPYDPGGTMIC